MKYKQQKYIIIFILVICIILLIYKISIKKNVDNLVILYVIRSIPKYYETRIKSQYDTWFKFLTKNDKVLIASEKKNHNNKFDLNFNIPDCPPGHGDGPCCSESNALVKALNNYKFDWIFILDDDVYLYPPKVREIINKYKDNHGIAIGTVGCVAKDISGFCGGGGYGFSRRVLEKLIDNNENEFLNLYKNHCNNTQYCDITTADLLVKKGIELINIPELRPWGIQKSDENDILENKVATLHYYGGELTKDYKEIPEKMGYLHNLFKKIKEKFTNFKEFFSNRDRIYISLTSIPSRLENNKFKEILESLLNQTNIFEKILLNIPYYSIRFKQDYNIPNFLKTNKYKDKIKIIRCEDYGAGTKLLGCLDYLNNIHKNDKTNIYIIILDDDRIYDSNIINNLYKSQQNNPNSIITNILGKDNLDVEIPYGCDGISIPYNLINNKEIKDFFYKHENVCRYVDDVFWYKYFVLEKKYNIIKSDVKTGNIDMQLNNPLVAEQNELKRYDDNNEKGLNFKCLNN